MKALVLAALLFAPVEGPMDKDKAQQAVTEAFEAGDYDRMVELSEAAYESTGNPGFLYSQAQAERFRGNCGVALTLYARMLAKETEETWVEAAREGIRICEQELAAQPESPEPEPQPHPRPPPPQLTSAEPPPERDVDPTPPDRDSWRTDRLGVGLLSAGGVAAAAAVALVVSGDAVRRRAPERGDESGYLDARDQSRALSIAGIAVGGVAVALLTGAAIRLALVSRRGRRSTASRGLVVRF